jgi:hypothetical protein
MNNIIKLENIKKKIVPSLIKEYSLLFQSEKVKIPRKDLMSLANISIDKAVINFNKLKSPKICSDLETYVNFWLREEFEIFYLEKSIKKINFNNPADKKDEYLVAMRNIISLLSPESINLKYQQLFGQSSFENRRKIFHQYEPLLKKLKKPFAELVKSRNFFAKKQGYKDFLSLKIQKDKIPLGEYKFFLKNVSEVIKFLNSQLPEVKNLPDWFYDPLNQPCLLCKIPFKDFETPEEIIKYVVKLYPQLKLHVPKIRLSYGEGANMRYLKEQDIFSVNIRKNINKRHQMVDVIHELGHVIYFIDGFTENEDLLKQGSYVAEKAAIKMVLKTLNSLNPLLLHAYYLDLLLVIYRTLFELETLKNPNQNYDLLYAKLFNKCVIKTSQKSNPLYLLDERIIFQPLTSLKTAVAIVNLMPNKL